MMITLGSYMAFLLPARNPAPHGPMCPHVVTLLLMMIATFPQPRRRHHAIQISFLRQENRTLQN